jgi:hypothetical protein
MYATITDALDTSLIGLEVEVIRDLTEHERYHMFSSEVRDNKFYWVSLFVPSLGTTRVVWKSEESLWFKGESCTQ